MWQGPWPGGSSGPQCWPCFAHRYKRLSEVVELLFPPLDRGPSTDLASPEYSSFCYWREPLTTVDLDTLA